MQKEDIVEIYLRILEDLKRLPTQTEMFLEGATRDQIRSKFGNLSELHKYVLENHSDIVSENILHEEFILKASQDTINSFDRFFITTIVNEKKVPVDFYKSVKKYCEVNNALLLCLPSIDVWNIRNRNTWSFDVSLMNEYFVFDHLQINENLYINSVTQNSKNVNPTTGFARMVQKKGSMIFASPKQNLEFVIHSPEAKIPRAMMTTGCMTIPDYDGASAKQNYIAENDHVLGGIIVERESDTIFHFRQVQMNEDGSFEDLATTYFPKGHKTYDDEIYLIKGDWHSGKTDKVVDETTEKIVEDLNVDHLVYHDLFNGGSVSPHDIFHTAKMAQLSFEELSLKHELMQGARDLERYANLIEGKMIVTKGNHDEFLERWVVNGSFMSDRINYAIGLDLAAKYHQGISILPYAYEVYGELKPDVAKRIIWLERDEPYEVAGIQIGQHGDKGLNGSKGTMIGIEKAYGSAIVGHTHSPAILRGIYRVGTSTELDMGYNRGPSSWAHAHCLLRENGTRQLLQIINGRYKLN